jgi:hypothetical protein
VQQAAKQTSRQLRHLSDALASIAVQVAESPASHGYGGSQATSTLASTGYSKGSVVLYRAARYAASEWLRSTRPDTREV